MSLERGVSNSSVTKELPQIHQFQLVRILGKGGMGVVYEAYHVRLHKRIALKLLSPHFAGSPDAIPRFEREMAAIGQLSHPNIVQALDAGVDQNTHYLAMEFIDGPNAETLIQQKGQMRVADACEIIRQATLGLAHAHSFGIVHRDIKPSNLLVSSAGDVKVADLGLARFHLQMELEELTSNGAILGTYDYMSPEQANSVETGPASDIYSLGATLYRLLEGQPVFSGPSYDSAIKKLHGHIADAPPRLKSIRQDIPTELDELVQRMLSKVPSDRPSSHADISSILSRFAQGANLPWLIEAAEPVAQSEKATKTFFVGMTHKIPAKPNHVRTASIAGMLLIGLAALGFYIGYLTFGRHAAQHSASATPDDSKRAELLSPELIRSQTTGPFNSEYAESLLWYPVLKHPPTKLIWPSDFRTSLSHDPGRLTMNASCSDTGLLSFGEARKTGFRLRMDLYQNHWPGDFGIVIGMNLQPGDRKMYRGQGLLFRRLERPRSFPEMRISRCRLVLTESSEGDFSVKRTNQHEWKIPLPQAEIPANFELDISVNGLSRIRLGEVDLSQLYSQDINDEFDANDYVGQFGMVLFGTDITISNVDFMQVQN